MRSSRRGGVVALVGGRTAGVAAAVALVAEPAAGGSGRQDVFVALYVNDVGGSGRWSARWFVRGRQVAARRFSVRPEQDVAP